MASLAPPGLETSASTAIVQVAGLTKTFANRRGWQEMLLKPWQRAERTTVLDHVSFEVHPAEFFGLLGANGAGKTTLFRILGAQLLPDTGSAVVAGYDVERDPRAVKSLLTPVVADERSLNWRLTARENLELFAALYGVERASVADRVASLLETVELHETGTKMVGTFSSGMKQRLLIARALLAQPRVLLLDEPTRSLDPVSARRFRRFLQEEIAGRQQCTVLLATHNADEAFELCNRVAVLDRGRLLAVGRVEDLMDRVRDDHYRITVRESDVAAVRRAVPAGVTTDLVVLEDRGAPGWTVLDVSIEGGPDGAAELVARLTRAGVSVAGMEHRPLALADLLERTVRLEAVQ
ncbi:MAG: ABC transporter ATP-binding protein [Gemmatimonadota bacterium]